MNVKLALASAGLAAASLSAFPALAAKYSCAGGVPCIVEADELGKRRIGLKWSGQGKKYDFYKIIVRLHGGGEARESKVPGGKQGRGVLNLKKAGDYEITVAGCHRPGKPGEQPVCRPSNEKVRINLR